MPQPMNTVVVLVASPSDAAEERASVRDVVIDWSIDSGRRQQVVALPWLYERSAVPFMGARPQAIINAQAVDRADVVIAIFDSRLGTHTGADVSGTAEEIRRAIELDKPVHVYFSTENLPRDVDPDQLTALREFEGELRTQGLLGNYSDPLDLAGQVRNALQHDVDDRGWSEQAPAVARNAGARLIWEHQREREQKGLDKRGKMTYTTRNRLVVRNEGNVAADELKFDVVEPDAFARLDGPDLPVTLHPDSELSWSSVPIRSGTVSIEARWSEDGQTQTQTRTVTVGG